jgi:uncharacterized protein (DUF302 family)
MSTIETRQIAVQRFSVTSSEPFTKVVAAIEKEIGHPDMRVFGKQVVSASTPAAMGEVVAKAVGPLGLMEFTRFDLGAILRKEQGDRARQSLRLVMGNPLVMKEMLKHVPDAGSYAPVTILIDERDDGVHLSYDRMASLLAPYGSSEALKVAQDLDAKVESLLVRAAA